jgi:hypothetical protein
MAESFLPRSNAGHYDPASRAALMIEAALPDRARTHFVSVCVSAIDINGPRL